MSIVAVSFDNFELNEMPYKVTKYTPSGSPPKNIKAYKIARNHGQKKVFRSYDVPTLSIVGEIITSSQTELDLAIDDLKRLLRRDSGILEIEFAGGVRRWVGEVKNFTIPRDQEHRSFTPYSIDFELDSPFSTDGENDVLVDDETVITSSADFAFAITGTMDANPFITIQVNSIDPDDSVTELSVANVAASQYLTITEILEAGDVITIDCENFRVFINGELTRAKGQFPIFDTGGGSLQYNDDADDREVVISASAEKRFL